MFYSQKLCPTCQKLIVGHSPKSYRAANSDLGQRLKRHKQDCQKQGKQLNLTIPGPEQEQTESIKKVSLRGKRLPPGERKKKNILFEEQVL